jgi:glycosyltransferase involved in cell wall biosynthesis
VKVAIVHDYLTQRGGAERVVLNIAEAFPGAEIVTSLYSPEDTFPEFRTQPIRTLSVNRIGFIRRHHRAALLAYPAVFSRARVDADVVICSSSGWAHGIQTDGTKIVFCYTPARWLYQGEEYARESSPVTRAVLRAATPLLRRWDRRAASTASAYVAISTVVAKRIADVYGRSAEVVPPPPALDGSGDQQAVAGVEPGYFLTISRLLPYKNVDATVLAFRKLPNERLVVVGKGPDAARLRQLAGENVTFLSNLSDAQLRWLYSRSRALVAASYEDYGLTPLEAAAFGKPVAALRWGGYIDTVVEDRTGTFFEQPTPDAIAAAVAELGNRVWDERALRDHAGRFATSVFIDRLRALVADATAAASPADTA